MSFRARLTAAVVLAVALPVIVASVVLLLVLPASARHRVDARVGSARATAETSLRATCAAERQLATTLAQAKDGFDSAVTVAADAPGSGAVLLDAHGRTVSSAAHVGSQNAVLTGLLSTAPDCSSGGVGGPRVVAARVATSGGGTAVVGKALDPALAGGTTPTLFGQVQDAAAADLTLALPADPARSTLRNAGRAGRVEALALSPAAPSGLAHADGVTLSVLPLGGGAALVVSRPDPAVGGAILLVLLVGLAVLLAAGLAGWRLARAAVRPLGELSGAAERVTQGDLDFRLPVRSADEVGRLALAFNTMTEALRRTITDLRASRDELQRNVSRLGDTLSGTHDLDRILGVIVDTAMVSVRATAGALLLISASGDQLYLRVGRAIDDRLPAPAGPASAGRRVRIQWRPGEPGVAARVAVTGEGVHGRIGEDGLATAPDEPSATTVLATPLRSGGRITGVLTLYDRADGQAFDRRDLQIVDSFTSQAVTAVDNVLLHQEAQRLSITDGLTGLWNYRYAILALAREVERASRFGRPLAVLMLDLDRFKRVNDRYGHQRGDAVLIEVAGRVRTVVREVDILARYGGEELILIAPETDLAGAEALAAKVRAAIRSSPVGGPDEEPLLMTTSLGVAVYPQHSDGARGLLRAADAALYAAKAAGRDCWRVAGQESWQPDGGSGDASDPPVPSAR